MTNIEMLTALATSPPRAFEALAGKPRWLFPLLLLVLATLAMAFWYYSIVDVQWLVDEQLRGNPRTANLSEEQRAQLAQFSSRTAVLLGSLIFIVVILPLFRVLEATWYTLAGKVTNVDRSFAQWFALACWTSLPGVLAAIPALLSLATAETSQLDPGVLQPLSLNELFFHRGMGEPGYQLLSNFGVLQARGLALAVNGVHTRTKTTWLLASVLVLLPCVLIFGLVLLAMARA